MTKSWKSVCDFPEDERLLTTLDQLKVPTARGQVPLSNFIAREPVQQLAEINRRDTERFFLVRADVDESVEGVTDIGMIARLEEWIANEAALPGVGDCAVYRGPAGAG